LPLLTVGEGFYVGGIAPYCWAFTANYNPQEKTTSTECLYLLNQRSLIAGLSVISKGLLDYSYRPNLKIRLAIGALSDDMHLYYLWLHLFQHAMHILSQYRRRCQASHLVAPGHWHLLFVTQILPGFKNF
jgi:hypothetical protein